MALQVTTANPGTISGVTTAQPGTISGVTTASPGTLSGVSSTPSGTNYNPQGNTGSATTITQPAAPVSTLMPNTTSGQNINQTPGANSQTFFLGDGSTYNSAGQQINAPTTSNGNTSGYSSAGGATVATPAATLNTPTPTISQPSTSLTNDTSYSDIKKLLTDNLANMDKLFANMSNYASVPQTEQDEQKKVTADAGQVSTFQGQAAGLDNPDNQAIALPFLTGQGAQKLRSAQIQQGVDQATLNYMQGNRQFAFNSASTIFDASQKELQTTLDAYTKMAPQNLSTNYNPTTGAVNAIMRNPLTGETYTAPLGNIGAQQTYSSTSIQTDPLTGALTFIGTKPDGTVVSLPVSGNGTGGATIQNPTQGSSNYTQTSQPSTATSTVGGLLSNWTSGGTTTPGSGYQGAVYQEFAKQTGQTIDANTPTSTLVSNIPALAAGIAKAENISPALLAATNNPGAILYANQPGATAYKAQNGYTYAKFDTLQDGQNAMNDLIAKKLGAVPQTAQPGPNLQAAIQQLPAALQGSVHYLPDGTPFFNANQLTSAQIPMAQFAASKTGIPYINGDNASKLDTISVAQQNLQSLSDYAQKTLMGGGVFGKIGNIIQGSGLNTFFGSTVQTNFDTYRNLAISSLQSLVGGSGSSIRITAGEIASQIDNIPKSSDTPGQAATKAAALQAQLNKWTAQIIPGWKPSGTSSNGGSSTVDYTATLNNLMQAYSPQ